MKNSRMYFILLIFLMMNCSGKHTCSTDTLSIRTEKLIMKNISDFIKVYSLEKSDGSLIGNIYVNFINDTIFTDLYVINECDTLYSIEKSTFSNKAGKDVNVFSDGFYGYLFVLKKNDYFVLSYLRNNGTNVSDDITIAWNYDKDILESQKIP